MSLVSEIYFLKETEHTLKTFAHFFLHSNELILHYSEPLYHQDMRGKAKQTREEKNNAATFSVLVQNVTKYKYKYAYDTTRNSPSFLPLTNMA